jgi:protocatechuate 3,4-dioxygenase beta subunit
MKVAKREKAFLAPGYNSVLIVLFVLFESLSGIGAETNQRPNLTGVVLNDDGSPVPEATVIIYTAGPRTGTSTICPSCYADCAKRAATDSNGRFTIESVSPNLLFRVLVVAKAHKPKFKGKVDPFLGPAKIALETFDPQKLGPKQALRGRVTDTKGDPIFGAAVNFEVFFGEEANCGGACDGVDPVAVTGADGRFLLAAEKKFDWMTVSVESRGFARRKFFQLCSTNSHELQLTEGATVTGRLLDHGRPVRNITAGIVSVDRSENFTGNFEAATDNEGRFSFSNIPPYQQYFVYTTMDSTKELGCLPVKRVRVAADGTTKDVGDLSIEQSFGLTGRVVLSDGKPLPPHSRIQVSRQDAWDFQSVEVASDGKFLATGLPPEGYSVSLRVPGYTVSTKNGSLDRLNGDSLVGLIEQNTDLVLLLDPGEFKRPDLSQGVISTEDRPSEKPLRGAAIDHR